MNTIDSSKIKAVKIGVCYCGKDATIEIVKLLSPSKRSKPRKVCQDCLKFELLK